MKSSATLTWNDSVKALVFCQMIHCSLLRQLLRLRGRHSERSPSTVH